MLTNLSFKNPHAIKTTAATPTVVWTYARQVSPKVITSGGIEKWMKAIIN